MYRLYLLIDEYDNFANEILMGEQAASRARYETLLRGEGALKAVFKTVKAAAAGWGLDRVFITGVAPIVLSDMTSGYNVAKNIYLSPQFHDLCGFNEAEVGEALNFVVAECGLPASEAEAALDQMRQYYNGYRFSDAPDDLIYNPTLALYFLDHFQQRCQPPSNMLDSNLAMDRGKLSYIAGLPEVILDAIHNEADLAVPVLADRFGVEDVVALEKDKSFMASLLYYFGVLTLVGRGALGKLQLRIPNLVIRGLYVERLRALLLPDAEDREEGRRRGRKRRPTGANWRSGTKRTCGCASLRSSRSASSTWSGRRCRNLRPNNGPYQGNQRARRGLLIRFALFLFSGDGNIASFFPDIYSVGNIAIPWRSTP
ncbi:MAG: AAA family ATPase [Blastocatellia bacterium]